MLQLTETDNGRKIKLKKGDRVVIKLFSNPTTGYDWEMQPNDHFSVSKEFLAKDSKVIGSGGTATFEVISHISGQKGTLLFRYKRPWEQSSEEEKRFSIDYQIH
jgi:inhibitor of cysteine peptidase